MYHAILFFFFISIICFTARKFACCRLKTSYLVLVRIWRATYSHAFSACFRVEVLYCTFSPVFSLQNKSSSFKLSAHMKSLSVFSLLDSLHTHFLVKSFPVFHRMEGFHFVSCPASLSVLQLGYVFFKQNFSDSLF